MRVSAEDDDGRVGVHGAYRVEHRRPCNQIAPTLATCGERQRGTGTDSCPATRACVPPTRKSPVLARWLPRTAHHPSATSEIGEQTALAHPSLFDHIPHELHRGVRVVAVEVVQHAQGCHFSAPTYSSSQIKRRRGRRGRGKAYFSVVNFLYRAIYPFVNINIKSKKEKKGRR